MHRWQGQSVVVTGASSGIGEALAREFAREGADIALVARRADRLERIAEEIRSRLGVAAHPIRADLADPDAPADVIDRSTAALGRIDVLVNNAGFGWFGRFWEQPIEDVHRLIQVDLSALTELTWRAIPPMIERRRGTILNVASVGGFYPCPWLTVYSAVKAYVVSFSQSLAVHLAPHGVRVVCVCPGTTSTEFFDKWKGMPSRQRMRTMSAERVALATLRQLAHRKTIIAPGGVNRVLCQIPRFLPRLFATRWAEQVMRPASTPDRPSG